jgi:HAD superfamily hydrolase (TIGR01490 family)
VSHDVQPPLAPGRARAAFFDVDGTLTTITTMFDFLDFYLRRSGRHADYARLRQRLHAMTEAGASRAAANRAYYQIYAGEPVGDVRAAGAQWFAERHAAGGIFAPDVLAASRGRAAAGDLMVLISGSFAACLDPVAGYLGADMLIASRPETRDGRYTGRIDTPMIGAAKAAAARDLAAALGLPLPECSAYGDHPSDQPLLDLVGHAYAVGDDEVLIRAAAVRGWRRLSAPRPADPTRKGAGA